MFDAERLAAVRAGPLFDIPGAPFEAELRLVTAAIAADGAFVVIADPERPQVLASTTGGEGIATALARPSLATLVEGRVVQTDAAGSDRAEALVAAPLRGPRGHVLAGLCVWCRSARTWSAADLGRLDDAVLGLNERLLRWVDARTPKGGSPTPAGERFQLHRELERREDWFDVVLDSLPTGVLVARAPDGQPMRANAEILRLLRSSAIDNVDWSRPIFSVAGAPLPPNRHPLARALKGETVRGALSCSVEDPERKDAVWWRMNAAPIRARGGDVAGAVLTVEDITEVRAMQDALYRSQEHLLHAQKMEAVGRLAGGMAHDFNNLLTAIMGFGELLLEGMGRDDPGRGDANEIVRSASRGRDLTDQLLSFSRRRTAHPSVLDPNEVVASSRRLLERLLGADVQLDTALHEETGPVRIDRTELEQIIVNLALNARDALTGDRGTVRIETAPVHFDRAFDAEPEPIPRGRWETLTVIDHGTGMDAALRLRIFEPFFTTKPPGEGTGLGLATVYGIVKRVGGYVRVDSRPDAGTTFRIYLPPDDGMVAPTPPTPTESRPSGSGTVLLAEDQDQIRSLLARQLERAGFDVLEAANGHEALALWRRDPGAIDIIVSDIVMPVMDGPSLVERIRADSPGLPVVFISGYPGAADPSERDTPLPEAHLLRKPFAAGELVAAIRAGLDGS